MTKQETKITNLVCRGFMRREIANELCIDDTTARNHMNNIHRKTQTKNAVLLMHWYFENNKGINLQKLLQ